MNEQDKKALRRLAALRRVLLKIEMNGEFPAVFDLIIDGKDKFLYSKGEGVEIEVADDEHFLLQLDSKYGKHKFYATGPEVQVIVKSYLRNWYEPKFRKVRKEATRA